MKLTQEKKWLAEAVNSISRYLDDLLDIDNPYFEQMNKAKFFDTEAPILDLGLYITNGIVSSKMNDKWDNFNFEIVNSPFLDGDVPRPLPMVYIFRSLFVSRECVLMLMTSTTETTETYFD